jgi:pyrimidine operon attenuation protein/uracil phosphoribosyltransferase
MLSEESKCILNAGQIEQKIARLAHEIHEHHYGDAEIVMVGILDRGFEFAARLNDYLLQHTDIEITLASLQMDKDDPLDSFIHMNVPPEELAGKTVLLVDDVLNSGRTAMYAARHILAQSVRDLKTVFLVKREHRRFPIMANYVGMALATTLREHITVVFGENEGVYLN